MEVIFSDNTREQYEDKPWRSGAQGEIYRSADQQHVHLVKLLTPRPGSSPDWMSRRIKQVDKILADYDVIQRDPYWEELFSWPERRVVSPRPGVRMRNVQGLTRIDSYFFANAYKQLSPEQKGWWIGHIACAIKMARAVRRLAAYGLCHSDLSDKNMLVDPFHGRMTVIDCDSLVVPGELRADVLGTPEYMAPELVSEREDSPSVESDRHSLAVLLYRWLLFRHPLIGRLVFSPDQQVDDRLRFGDRALYVEHPSDPSNRPARPVQLTASTLVQEIAPGSTARTVSALTPRLAGLFEEAFVRFLHEPAQRPLPERWEHALLELYDRVIPCSNPQCTLKYFAASDVEALRCPLCHAWAEIPGEIPLLRLKVPLPVGTGGLELLDEDYFGHFIVGWRERPLYGWHAYRSVRTVPLPTEGPPDTEPVATVHYDATQGGWLLENQRLPELQLDDGFDPDVPQWQPVPPGSSVPLRDGLRLLLSSQEDGRCVEVEMRQVYKTDE